MSDSARDLLVRGVAAAKAGDKQEASFYLEWVLRTDAGRQQQIDAWWWLSEICDEPKKKREYLENILAYDMNYAPARRSLAILDGRLDPADVIDPSRPSVPQTTAPRRVQTEQFTCPNCQGQMSFSPDGQSLICPYCGQQQKLAEADGTVDEEDFILALATAKGHGRAVAMQAFQCQGCAASFVLGPAVLSLTCPYCASAHVVRQAEERRLVTPEAIIPFTVTAAEAGRALSSWLKNHGLGREVQTTSQAGLYVPAWTFDVGGEIRWQERVIDSHHTRLTSTFQSQSRPVSLDDFLVPAGKKLTRLPAVFRQFRLEALVPYEPGYLADWPAETYQLSAADASLAARQQAYEQACEEVRRATGSFLAQAAEITFNSAGLVIEGFKLVLLPLWLARYHYRNMSYGAIINGQTSHVTAKLPRGKLRRILADFFEPEN